MQEWSQSVLGEIDEIQEKGIEDIINMREPDGKIKEEWEEFYKESIQKKDKSVKRTSFYAQRDAWLKKRGPQFDF